MPHADDKTKIEEEKIVEAIQLGALETAGKVNHSENKKLKLTEELKRKRGMAIKGTLKYITKYKE